VSFLRRLISERPQARRRDGIAARMFEDEGLGELVGARVYYSSVDYTKAENMLLTRGFDLVAMSETFSRSQAPRGGSEKTGALAVTFGMVAVVAVNMDETLITPLNSFHAMAWEAAAALPYEVLLVCENLEPLMQLREYHWMADFIKGRPTLAIFRGGPGMFTTSDAAKIIAEDVRPTLAFFDFDPKGLSMAASLPRREAICLPNWKDLEAAILRDRRDHLFSNSVHVSRSHLDRVVDPEITLAWQRLKVLTIGLNQEGFPRGNI
jgi:hypothetical protein